MAVEAGRRLTILQRLDSEESPTRPEQRHEEALKLSSVLSLRISAFSEPSRVLSSNKFTTGFFQRFSETTPAFFTWTSSAQKEAIRTRKSSPSWPKAGIARVSSLPALLLRNPAFLPSSSQSQFVKGISRAPCPSGRLDFDPKNSSHARSTLIVPSRTS